MKEGQVIQHSISKTVLVKIFDVEIHIVCMLGVIWAWISFMRTSRGKHFYIETLRFLWMKLFWDHFNEQTVQSELLKNYCISTMIVYSLS